MAIKKIAVAAAVNSAAKASKKAESSSTKNAVVEVTDWDKVLINSNTSEDVNTNGKRYANYLGKDRLIRQAPGWDSATGKTVEFVIYATDENGTPLPELPPTRFGSLADVEYTEKRYPMSKGFYINDTLCKNGRHRITVYRIHITGVIDTPLEVQ